MASTIDPEDFADAAMQLIKVVREVNETSAVLRGMGLSVEFTIDGYETGHRIGVSLQGQLVDAHEKAEAARG